MVQHGDIHSYHAFQSDGCVKKVGIIGGLSVVWELCEASTVLQINRLREHRRKLCVVHEVS